jgi:hypothetical protein
MNTQTPRTDAHEDWHHANNGRWNPIQADFARTLERELADARTQTAYFRERLEAWQDANGHMADRFDACLAEKARLRATLAIALAGLETCALHADAGTVCISARINADKARAALVQS